MDNMADDSGHGFLNRVTAFLTDMYIQRKGDIGYFCFLGISIT